MDNKKRYKFVRSWMRIQDLQCEQTHWRQIVTSLLKILLKTTGGNATKQSLHPMASDSFALQMETFSGQSSTKRAILKYRTKQANSWPCALTVNQNRRSLITAADQQARHLLSLLLCTTRVRYTSTTSGSLSCFKPNRDSEEQVFKTLKCTTTRWGWESCLRIESIGFSLMYRVQGQEYFAGTLTANTNLRWNALKSL